MERQIELPGCHNFRDLGGYPTASGRRVRWRRLFRADALHLLEPEGVDRFLGELQIGTIVDLRSTGEIETDGRGPLRDHPPRYHHLPMFDATFAQRAEAAESFTLADRYFLMAEHAKGPIATVISTLVESSGPAVYHCAAGKDRTGVVSAILLALCGVDDEVIVADYAATRENLDAIVNRLMNSEGYREMLESLPSDTMHAEPETMFSLLGHLKENYGSVAAYARDIGITDETLARLESELLE